MDLIDRAKLLNIIKNELAYQEKHATPGEDIDTGIICGLGQAVEIVKGIEPSAEKTGEWIEASDLIDNQSFSECKCSECGVVEYFNKGWKRFNYCPNCGAKMEVEHEIN